MNSRAKGKRGELEARNMVRKYWHAPGCIRAAQVSGKFSADLMGALPGAHVEVKLHAKIGAMRFMDQAMDDRDEIEYPVVLMKEKGGSWMVMFRIEDTSAFVSGVMTNFRRQEDE